MSLKPKPKKKKTVTTKPKRKYKFVFIATPKGDHIGRIIKSSNLDDARKKVAQYSKDGYDVSEIAKTTKL